MEDSAPKKDLTGLMDLSQPSPEADAISAGEPVLDDPVDNVQEFESLEAFSASNPSETSADSPLAFNTEKLSGQSDPATPDSSDDQDFAGLSDFTSTAESSESSSLSDPSRSPIDEPARAKETPAAEVLEQVRNFSENLSVGKPAVAAEFPFSLLIRGHLNAFEREKLLDLLERENMGVSAEDLKPQFDAGQILIPRISEFAGVLLVQALRGARAELRLGPSDTIFSTEDTRSESRQFDSATDYRSQSYSSDESHPAERIPVTSGPTLPGSGRHEAIDTITATTVLKTTAVHTEHSSEYHEVLEALQRELKYRAHAKGATAVIHFSVALVPIAFSRDYRLTVMGTAIRTP